MVYDYIIVDFFLDIWTTSFKKIFQFKTEVKEKLKKRYETKNLVKIAYKIVINKEYTVQHYLKQEFYYYSILKL